MSTAKLAHSLGNYASLAYEKGSPFAPAFSALNLVGAPTASITGAEVGSALGLAVGVPFGALVLGPIGFGLGALGGEIYSLVAGGRPRSVASSERGGSLERLGLRYHSQPVIQLGKEISTLASHGTVLSEPHGGPGNVFGRLVRTTQEALGPTAPKGIVAQAVGGRFGALRGFFNSQTAPAETQIQPFGASPASSVRVLSDLRNVASPLTAAELVTAQTGPSANIAGRDLFRKALGYLAKGGVKGLLAKTALEEAGLGIYHFLSGQPVTPSELGSIAGLTAGAATGGIGDIAALGATGLVTGVVAQEIPALTHVPAFIKQAVEFPNVSAEIAAQRGNPMNLPSSSNLTLRSNFPGLRTQPYLPPSPPIPPPVPPINNLNYRQPAPQLDLTKPCPECDAQFRRQITQEERQLQQERQVEQNQLTNEKLQQIQQQLDQLHQAEQRPASTRNIQQELQQKAQLQTQLQEIQSSLSTNPGGPAAAPQQQGVSQQQGQGHPETPGQLAPQVQTEAGAAAQQAAEKAIEQPVPKMQFCVGCATEEDAVLFLNGEPASCSVIPGSYKSLEPLAAQSTNVGG